MRVFKETQGFTQWWMHIITGGLVVFLIFCLYNWFIAEKAVGNVSETDTTAQLVVILSLVPVLLFLYTIKLKTAIDEIGIHYQFFPLHFSMKTKRWVEIQKCYVREYSPIKEYGGWGYRISLGNKGKALNIKGNTGIQLIFNDGKKLLLGTQRKKEAEEILKRYTNKGDE